MTLTPKQRVIWLYTPRGGYGYTQRVDAEVVKIGPKLVKIRVRRIRPHERDEERWVKPERLEEVVK
jgi:hypothetical protein